MSRISILVFAPEPLNPPSRTSSVDSASTLSDYDFALLLTPRHSRLLHPFHSPAPLLFTRNNPTPIPSITFPLSPILNIHIATTKPSHLPTLLTRLSTSLPPTSSPAEYLTLLLQSLQKSTIVPRFSVPKFQQFVNHTLQKQPLSARRPSSGTTEIDYLALLSSNAEVKKMLSPELEGDEEGSGGGERTICGFRFSSGGREKVLTNRMVEGWERRDDPYGGLM